MNIFQGVLQCFAMLCQYIHAWQPSSPRQMDCKVNKALKETRITCDAQCMIHDATYKRSCVPTRAMTGADLQTDMMYACMHVYTKATADV